LQPRAAWRTGKRRRSALLIDTNVLIRLLTGDPPDQAERAAAVVGAADPDTLILTDLVVAECAYVLESAYRLSRQATAEKLREAIATREVRVAYPELLDETIDIFAEHGLDFVDAYLCALDRLSSNAGPVLSFDRGLDAVAGVERAAP
jgi:predicted nucleic acid-binding protein